MQWSLRLSTLVTLIAWPTKEIIQETLDGSAYSADPVDTSQRDGGEAFQLMSVEGGTTVRIVLGGD